MIKISTRASRELQRMGCHGPNFLRITHPNEHHGCSFFIDSIMGSVDEVIHDGDVKIVTDTVSRPFLGNLSIDSSDTGIIVH